MADFSIEFHHLHLISENPKSCATWYAEKLGGRIVGGPDALAAPSILVTFKGTILIIRSRNADEKVSPKQGPEWGVDHFGFQVNGDFDAYCGELKNKGVVFTLDPKDLGPNLRVAFIQAPDGVSIELLQRR